MSVKISSAWGHPEVRPWTMHTYPVVHMACYCQPEMPDEPIGKGEDSPLLYVRRIVIEG
jgi:hypothetical protein